MRTFEDLMKGLEEAENLRLIERIDAQRSYLDIDFYSTKMSVGNILNLRDFIKQNYSFVQCVDYMPIVCRLRLYGQF